MSDRDYHEEQRALFLKHFGKDFIKFLNTWRVFIFPTMEYFYEKIEWPKIGGIPGYLSIDWDDSPFELGVWVQFWPSNNREIGVRILAEDDQIDQWFRFNLSDFLSEIKMVPTAMIDAQRRKRNAGVEP